MGEDDFEFDFFSEQSRATAGEEWGGISWDEDDSSSDEDVSDRRERPLAAAAGRPSRELVIRRRLAAAAAVVALLLLIVLIVVVTQGSGGGAGSDQRYAAALSPIAASSQQTGASLVATLAAKPVGRSSLASTLDGLVQQAVSDLGRLQGVTAPTALQAEQQQAVTVLDLRLQALVGIRDSLPQALQSALPTTWIPLLAGDIDQLVASDEIWENLVRTRIDAVLQTHGGAAIAPRSGFVTDPGSLRKSIENLLQTTVSATPALTLAAKGPAVVSWQKQLNQWLKLTGSTLTPLTPDGTFGPATVAATQALQTAQGLTPDGVVGPKTRQALQTALTNPQGSTNTG